MSGSNEKIEKKSNECKEWSKIICTPLEEYNETNAGVEYIYGNPKESKVKKLKELKEAHFKIKLIINRFIPNQNCKIQSLSKELELKSLKGKKPRTSRSLKTLAVLKKTLLKNPMSVPVICSQFVNKLKGGSGLCFNNQLTKAVGALKENDLLSLLGKELKNKQINYLGMTSNEQYDILRGYYLNDDLNLMVLA